MASQLVGLTIRVELSFHAKFQPPMKSRSVLTVCGGHTAVIWLSTLRQYVGFQVINMSNLNPS